MESFRQCDEQGREHALQADDLGQVGGVTRGAVVRMAEQHPHDDPSQA
jgi:hypothetical protein